MKAISLIIAAEKKISLWEELWTYFYDTYYGNSVYFANLGIDTAKMITIKNLIVALGIGLCLAAFATVYNKRVLGGLVRKLLKSEALSPDRALTLGELGAVKNPLLRYAVRKSVSLRRVVKCREEEDFLAEQSKRREEYEEKRMEDKSLPKFKEEKFELDPDNDHFYIPEEMKYTADIKFESKGTSLFGAIVFTVIMAIALCVIIYFLPDIFGMIDSLVGGFSNIGKGNIL